MTSAPSYRAANRTRLRESLIAAARELTIAHGWENVRMVDVAKCVGVSRQTVYNEFEGRSGLAQALALTEVEHFVAAVRKELFAQGADVRGAAYAAILHSLQEAADNPLVRAILTSARGGADELLPYLTTRAEAVLQAAGAAVQEWAAAHLPDADPATLSLAGESIIRLTVSHIVLPLAPPATAAADLAEVFVRLLR
ncbi:TetR/AcrR family transcriptional regulator [Couchioplanes caeruleus]|uniref:TetR family transcriptional regulator n=2 Tax=Couchioplanes caeruleus TaxID=56438 RepID=A0A1K0FSJ0_9ACTN|nr:TetR/AcrR family transcriptional regulator [Couchioplanes caeruleus]OJF15640.1 TetR family transcriptional regulator [Couchioplanes caeruleus subsp. caeruleus]ROP33819.1 TetR family transcriptional regulator [Couchioplanes caeruleus]